MRLRRGDAFAGNLKRAGSLTEPSSKQADASAVSWTCLGGIGGASTARKWSGKQDAR